MLMALAFQQPRRLGGLGILAALASLRLWYPGGLGILMVSVFPLALVYRRLRTFPRDM